MVHRLSHRLAEVQNGFTMIEMIVVVGIIALLTAVIVPNIGQFTGSGKDGAMAVEKYNVQEAFELMMAENQVTAITPHDKSNASTATASWNALPVGSSEVQPLIGYLVNSSTVYYYCYDDEGVVTEQFETATPCTVP